MYLLGRVQLQDAQRHTHEVHLSLVQVHVPDMRGHLQGQCLRKGKVVSQRGQ
jgi:hypothetical protein